MTNVGHVDLRDINIDRVSKVEQNTSLDHLALHCTSPALKRATADSIRLVSSQYPQLFMPPRSVYNFPCHNYSAAASKAKPSKTNSRRPRPAVQQQSKSKKSKIDTEESEDALPADWITCGSWTLDAEHWDQEILNDYLLTNRHWPERLPRLIGVKGLAEGLKGYVTLPAVMVEFEHPVSLRSMPLHKLPLTVMFQIPAYRFHYDEVMAKFKPTN